MKIKLLSIFCLSIQIVASEFNSDDGAPIRQGVHIEWYRTIAPGNDGEGIFVWSDTRFGMRNIFAHKIDQDGTYYGAVMVQSSLICQEGKKILSRLQTDQEVLLLLG